MPQLLRDLELGLLIENQINMSGWILASGGNEFHDEYRQADQAALDKRVDKSQPLLIVVTAPYPTQELAYEHAKQYFLSIGIKTKMSQILSHKDLTKSNLEELENSSGIYFAGGTPKRLVDAFINTLATESIFKALENDAVIMGSSAGSMLFGKKVVMPGGKIIGDGLNLLQNQIVLAHFSGTWPEWVEPYREQNYGLLGLSEGGSVLTPVTNETEKIHFGKVFIA